MRLFQNADGTWEASAYVNGEYLCFVHVNKTAAFNALCKAARHLFGISLAAV